VQLSVSYTDAAVIEVGRRHATQLPEPIAKELAGLNVGGITKPRVVENGVSMLAVCSKSVAQDTTFIKGNLRAEAGNAQLKGEQDKYLAELRKQGRVYPVTGSRRCCRLYRMPTTSVSNRSARQRCPRRKPRSWARSGETVNERSAAADCHHDGRAGRDRAGSHPAALRRSRRA
jgi:hypothetical protein